MKIPVRFYAMLLLLCAALAGSVATAAPQKSSKAINFKFVAGSGTPLVQYQPGESTSTIKILRVVNSAGSEIFSLTQAGNLTVSGAISPGLNGVYGFVADVVASNTLTSSGALTLTAGKGYFPVLGSGGAVTAITIPNGTTSGQIIAVAGTDSTNTVSFTVNGASNVIAPVGQTVRILGLGDFWLLVWDNILTKWEEVSFGKATNNNPALVASGGTGRATLTAHGVLMGEGTSAIAQSAAGTTGWPFVSGGASADGAYALLGVVGGGTGLATLTAHTLQVGNGTSTVTQLAAGTTGQVLTGVTGADPAFSATPTVTTLNTTGLTLGGAAGAVGSCQYITKNLQSLTDATATDAVTVTVPNQIAGASVRVTVSGTLGDGDSTDGKLYTIGISRIAGAATKATVSSATGIGLTTGATANATTAVTVSAMTGATSATQTFTIKVTVTRSTGSATNHFATVEAVVLNGTATGISLS